MSEHILFYSKKCQFCKQLFSLLENNPRIMNIFLIICIDDKRYRIPKAIKSVPSAIIPSPTGDPQIYTGKQLINWIKNRTNSQERRAPVQQSGNYPQQMGRNVQQQQQQQQQQVIEPEVWDSFMMNNLSGTFAYLDDNENEKVKDKNGFASLNSLYNFKISTPDDDGIKGKGDVKPVAYSTDDDSLRLPSSGGGRNQGNPFADSDSYGNQKQSNSNYNPNEFNPRANMGQSFDPNMFRDQNYEGNDSRSNSRKSQFDSQMEAFKNSRDMGMPQPLRRM
jgi:hypothetical protein